MKLCFFFGAGAEGNKNYNIVTGMEFLKETLYLDSIDNLEKKLFDFLKEKQYFSGTYKYSKCYFKFNINRTQLMSCIENYFHEHHDNLCDKIIVELRKNFGKKFIKKLKIKVNNDSKNKDNRIFLEFKKILAGDINKQEDVNSELLKMVFFNENGLNNKYLPTYCLDEYFHTIINPTKYGEDNFSKIFNYYWACYFCIVNSIIKNTSEENKKIISDYLNDNKLNYKKILINIKDFSEKLYKFNYDYINDSYYKLIKDKIDESRNDADKFEAKVITSNYYNFVEKLDKDPAYLNGNLRKFEIPEILEVTDFSDDKLNWDKFLFFPFIFGQSHVKPIVHPYQIEQFNNARTKLKEPKYLIIIGYHIGEEDNHINALLRNAIVNRKECFLKIIVVTSDSKEELCKNLKIDDIIYEKIRDSIVTINFKNMKKSEIVDEIFKYIKEKKDD